MILSYFPTKILGVSCVELIVPIDRFQRYSSCYRYSCPLACEIIFNGRKVKTKLVYRKPSKRASVIYSRGVRFL